MLGFGLKSHVGRVMDVGNYRVDQWFVGGIAGTRELGYYSVAVTLAEVLWYLPGVVVLVHRPDLVRASRLEAGRLAAMVLRRTLFGAVLAGAMLALLATPLCTIVFGEDFRASADDLRILCLAAGGVVLVELLSNALIAQRLPLQASIAAGAGFLVTITADLLLIPSLGGAGAAAATATAYTVGGLILAVLFCRLLGVAPRELVPRRDDVGWYRRKLRALASSLASTTVAPASASNVQNRRS
jgi:O-antigen/teichoic acid export membrane protein